MAIVRPGEKLPATYLERFDPAENVTYRFAILSSDAIATEHHWVDVPSKNIKGVYQCIQGACCQALGRRMQNYSVPIYVYRQAGYVEGDIYVWQMTPARWKKFSDMILGGVDLLSHDVFFTAVKRGQGMDWNYSILTDARYSDYWTPEQKEQITIAVKSFYQMGESSLVNPMNFNDWNQLLYDMGYDVNNQCWPGGQSPMNAGASFGAIRSAVGVGAGSMLPPPPPNGYLPSPQPQMPNIAGNGVILQPAPLSSHPSAVPPVPVPARPVGQPVNSGQPPVTTLSSQGHPAGSFILPQNGANTQGYIQPPAVPLGTVPVIPQQPAQTSTVTQQAGVVQSVPQQPVMQNTVPGTQEITAAELNNLLS